MNSNAEHVALNGSREQVIAGNVVRRSLMPHTLIPSRQPHFSILLIAWQLSGLTRDQLAQIVLACPRQFKPTRRLWLMVGDQNGDGLR
jgi:hypothetical protein